MVAAARHPRPAGRGHLPGALLGQLPGDGEAGGGVPVPVRPRTARFIPRIEDIEQVVGSYTKAIIINSPNNPSGAMYSREFIAEIVEFCEKRTSG
jgi:threonine aldolase